MSTTDDRAGRRVDPMADIDRQPDSASLVTIISHGCGGPVHTRRDRDLLPLLDLRPGQAVLEVGCGTGAVARELALLTGGAVRITAVDPSALVLEQARRETAVAGLGPLAEAIAYRQGDGRALAFPDASFAAALCSRVLIHTPQPEQVVAEMARVVEPGGRVLCIEPAHQFSALVPDELRARTTAFTNPNIGRELLGLLRRAGLRDVTITPHVFVGQEPPDVDAMRADFVAGRGLRAAAVRDGWCTAAEVEQVFDQIEAAVRQGAFWECQVHFAVVGRVG